MLPELLHSQPLEVSPGKSRTFLGQHHVPGSSCGSEDAVPGPTVVITHLEVKVGGRKPDPAWAEQTSAPCAGSYWGTVWLPLVLFLVGDWFQLDSVWLDPPREFLVDIQVLAEQINPSLP